MKVFGLFVLFFAAQATCLAEKNAELVAVMAEPGELVFTDDFEAGELSNQWVQIRGEWKVSDGTVVGKELKAEKHAAVFHCLRKNHNSMVRFSFRLDGAEGFHFSLNHQRGHLFRVLVSSESVVVRTDADKKDKTVRSEVIGKADAKFEQGKWYTMQIEMVDDQVAVTADNGVKVQGRNARLDTEKPNYRFILKDQFLALDDIKVWGVK